MAPRHLMGWPEEQAASWFTAESRSLLIELEGAAAIADLAGDAGDSASLVDIATIGRRDRSDAQLTESFGIALHDPFVDSSVIDACLVPSGELDRLRETIEVLSDHDLMRAVQDGLADLRSGRVVDADEVAADLHDRAAK